MIEQSVEQEARDLLERLDYPDAQSLSAGDVSELAGILNELHGLRKRAPDVVKSAVENSNFGLPANYLVRVEPHAITKATVGIYKVVKSFLPWDKSKEEQVFTGGFVAWELCITRDEAVSLSEDNLAVWIQKHVDKFVAFERLCGKAL